MTNATITTEPRIESQPECAPADQANATRRYMYCIVDCDAASGFAPMKLDGIPEVFAVTHEGTAAIVSAMSVEKLEISRGNALTHQRVMEMVMARGHTVLPVRFNTIAEDKGPKQAQQRIVDHVLAGRRDEIAGLLATMKSRVELGVKGLWTNMEAVFRQIVDEHPDVQSLRKKLMGTGNHAGARRQPSMTSQIKLGEMVKKALENRKTELGASLVKRLVPPALGSRRNKNFGDQMFANFALLVDKSRQSEVLEVLSAFESEQSGQVKLRCVGPLPPCNFLELVITWDDFL